MKKRSKKNYEPSQVLYRLLVLLVCGIIFYFWNIFTAVIFIINLIIALVKKKPNKDLIRFCSIWLIQLTITLKYLLFMSDEKPFPFSDIKINSNI